MLSFRFNNVRIEAFAFDEAPHEVSTPEIEDRLAELYERLGVPFGTLEKLSGVEKRRLYDPRESPSSIGTRVGKAALDRLAMDPAEIGVIFNCSVSRDFFEPATAVMIHHSLGFSEDVMAMDITNACIGFSNGLITLANMIDSGVVKAGLLISSEHLGPITDQTLDYLLRDEKISRSEFLGMLATFTLGSGAVAMVLAHESVSRNGHRVLGSVARSASQFNQLCMGNADFCFHLNRELLNPLMETDSRKLLAAAALLGQRTWQDTAAFLQWTSADIDHIFCHQVGRQVNGDFYKTMGLPIEKEHTVYQRYGNLVSAAMPSALIVHADQGLIQPGQKVLLLGFGSGLNSIFTGIEW